jgi:hypothetical protein
MNPIDDQIIEVMHKGVEIGERDFRGLVIHHQGENFSAGANLLMILEGIEANQWTIIDRVVREFATSKDGTKVPVNILFRKGTKRDGNNPTLAYGYGGYGISQNATHGRPRWMNGNNPAVATANTVTASAVR